MSVMQENLNKIFSILKTYENFELYMLNHDGSVNDDLLKNHISLWISQFDKSEQEFMVLIAAKLLEERFITKEEEIDFIKNLFSNNILSKNKTMPFPLDIQKNGNSQTRLIGHYNFFMSSFGYSYAEDSVIYLDDFIFSGGRVFEDLSNWIPLQEKSYKIYVVVIGCHTNFWRIEKLLNEKINHTNITKGINLSINFIKLNELENRLFRKNQSDVLWPMDHFFRNERYQHLIDPSFNYRDGFIATPQSFFTNNDDRVRFENICLKYGFEIIQRCQNPNRTTRPLGIHRYSYGFGGLVFSYKNCPNNTPLLFWWGSSNPASPMYNQWHPLMPRRIYG
ncbi:hypothetical protein F997_02737 [Acinetobacter calcoaceticus NIPH 13]|nr:hypothetical protein F997_02737 [Acinetobacter calcoaceticus NIPH 13]